MAAADLSDVYWGCVKHGLKEVDCRSFVALFRNASVMDATFKDVDAERVFSHNMLLAKRRLDYARFVEAVAKVAELKGMEEKDLHQRLIDTVEPRPRDHPSRSSSQPVGESRGEEQQERRERSKRRHRSSSGPQRRRSQNRTGDEITLGPLQLPPQGFARECGDHATSADSDMLEEFADMSGTLGPQAEEAAAAAAAAVAAVTTSAAEALVRAGSPGAEPQQEPQPLQQPPPASPLAQLLPPVVTERRPASAPAALAGPTVPGTPGREPRPVPPTGSPPGSAPRGEEPPPPIVPRSPVASRTGSKVQLLVALPGSEGFSSAGSSGGLEPLALPASPSAPSLASPGSCGSGLTSGPGTPSSRQRPSAAGRQRPSLSLQELEGAGGEEDERSGRSVEETFSNFCSGAGDMDSKAFVRLCKRCCLFDQRFSARDAHLVFSSAVPVSKTRMDLGSFEVALQRVAAKRGLDLGLVQRMVSWCDTPTCGEPKTQGGTQATALVTDVPASPAASEPSASLLFGGGSPGSMLSWSPSTAALLADVDHSGVAPPSLGDVGCSALLMPDARLSLAVAMHGCPEPICTVSRTRARDSGRSLHRSASLPCVGDRLATGRRMEFDDAPHGSSSRPTQLQQLMQPRWLLSGGPGGGPLVEALTPSPSAAKASASSAPPAGVERLDLSSAALGVSLGTPTNMSSRPSTPGGGGRPSTPAAAPSCPQLPMTAAEAMSGMLPWNSGPHYVGAW